MLVRQRKLKISAMHTMETFETINNKTERRETKREEKALTAAKIETAIEKELLQRL
jgi:protein MAK16